MIRTILFLALSAFVINTINAQPGAKPHQIANAFLKAYDETGLRGAREKLLAVANPGLGSTLLNKIQSQLSGIDTSFAFVNWVYVGDVSLTNDFICKSYLLKYDDKPYRLELLFYKKQGNWFIQDISVEANLFPEMQRAGRAEKLEANNIVRLPPMQTVKVL